MPYWRPSQPLLRLASILPAQPVQPGWHWYGWWDVPPGTLIAGTNEAAVVIDTLSSPEAPSGRPDGVAVARIVVSR
jgi:hypothetical protein